MFFHIDESGNTGLNLFDRNQPRLSYGVLSSRLNVDVMGVAQHRKMLRTLGVDQLHANELGTEGLASIAEPLCLLQQKMAFRFDYYYIDKLAYAVVLLFDAVFDAGINEAVKWDMYWTPLRYLSIFKLGYLLDEELLKESWELRRSKRIEADKERIVVLLKELKHRTSVSDLDDRTKELFIYAFDFGIARPLDLDFGFRDIKLLSPNAVGFQFVVGAIAKRSRAGRKGEPAFIKVDRQQQFNKAQAGTHYHQKLIAEGTKNASVADRRWLLNHPLYEGLDQRDLQLDGLPDVEPTFLPSSQSIGLQLVDVYSWIANRITLEAELPQELVTLTQMFLKNSVADSISMEGMMKRWTNFERKLPPLEALTEEQRELVQGAVEAHRVKVSEPFVIS